MAVVFPFVLAIVMCLIYFCMIELQIEIADNICEKYGLNLVKKLELSGIDNYIDFQNAESSKKYFDEIDPYRHIFDKDLSNYQKDLQAKLDEAAIIDGKHEVLISNKRVGFFKILEIQVSVDLKMLNFLTYFDISIPIEKICKKYCAIDKSEIVRNTDYIYELGEELMEKHDIFNKLKKYGVKTDNE